MRRLRPAAVPTLLLALLVLSACARPVPAAYADFIGHWRGDNVRLVIHADGRADYEFVSDNQRVSIRGPVHDFSPTGFRVGLGGPASADFVVRQAPHRADGRWRMTVDGHALTRIDILPVDDARSPSPSP